MDLEEYDVEFFLRPNAHVAKANACYAEILRKLGICGKSLLDYGCGSGYWIKKFLDLGGIVSGIDRSEIAVKRCQSLYPSCVFKTRNDNALIDYPDASFNYVTCSYVFQEIMDDDTFISTLEEIRRVLTINGLLVSVCNIYPDKRTLRRSTKYGDMFLNEGTPPLYRFFRGDTMSGIISDRFVLEERRLAGFSFMELYRKK